MQSDSNLRETLRGIDHKSYPAYKSLRGSYRFADYVLSIDHVQGDPFAAPSHVRVTVDAKAAAFPEYAMKNTRTRTALADELLRTFAAQINHFTFKAKGSGKSGLISVTHCGQEILTRTACEVNEKEITARFAVGFPANGRTINARELEKILFTYLPECVKHSFYYKNLDARRIRDAVELAEDQQAVRDQLKEQGLVAFVADDAVLPRESGISSRPMKQSVAFTSPESLRVTMQLPHRGAVTGMGIPKGITLIVGGGYHGKSTLLTALELGVYNHIAGDGREFVITDETALKLRSEDGRFIKDVDISMFINDLPNGKDTHHFSTEDASGSTSQAAGIVEGMEAGSRLFLLDEDTSVIHDDAVVYQAFHILNDVRGQENSFVFRAGIVTQIVHEEAAIAGVQTEREIVQYQQFWVLRQDKSQCHLRTLSARHTRDALSGSYFQFVHQVVVRFFAPLSRIESRIKLLNLPDGHELILHVSLDEQTDITAC